MQNVSFFVKIVLMNFIFISPNFPHTYWNFCERLKRNGVNVLGIGDAPYYTLEPQLQESLTEYYFVNDMEDYDKMYRAVAFFAFKYGKIDWLESNNEYWLEQDARLRSDFNITTGIGADGIANWKYKFNMKKFYAEAKIPSARCHKISTKPEAEKFVKEVGFPVIVKPDNGVGALDTWKLSSDEDFEKFFENPPEVQYVMEEFITGDIYSYDVIADSKCEPLFESSSVFPPSVMDVVNKKLDLSYFTIPEVPEQLRKFGRAALKAFGVKSRFAHMEFFCLTKPKNGIGNIGDFAGLEVNMRPAGGYTPDMMDFAHSTDVYQIWADMVVHDKRILPDSGEHNFCVYAARRDCHEYVHSHEEVVQKYYDSLVMCERMPEGISATMGNQMYTMIAKTELEKNEFLEFVLAKKI